MNSFTIHLSDAFGIDEQITIEVHDAMDIGRAAQIALDEVVEKHGAKLRFPIFVDIHPAKDFPNRAWMHERQTTVAVGE